MLRKLYLALRALRTAAPRFCTVGTNSSRSQASSWTTWNQGNLMSILFDQFTKSGSILVVDNSLPQEQVFHRRPHAMHRGTELTSGYPKWWRSWPETKTDCRHTYDSGSVVKWLRIPDRPPNYHFNPSTNLKRQDLQDCIFPYLKFVKYSLKSRKALENYQE